MCTLSQRDAPIATLPRAPRLAELVSSAGSRNSETDSITWMCWTPRPSAVRRTAAQLNGSATFSKTRWIPPRRFCRISCSRCSRFSLENGARAWATRAQSAVEACSSWRNSSSPPPYRIRCASSSVTHRAPSSAGSSGLRAERVPVEMKEDLQLFSMAAAPRVRARCG